MPAFDFPATPTEGQLFTPPGGPTYIWNAPKWSVYGGHFLPPVTATYDIGSATNAGARSTLRT